MAARTCRQSGWPEDTYEAITFADKLLFHLYHSHGSGDFEDRCMDSSVLRSFGIVCHSAVARLQNETLAAGIDMGGRGDGIFLQPRRNYHLPAGGDIALRLVQSRAMGLHSLRCGSGFEQR